MSNITSSSIENALEICDKFYAHNASGEVIVEELKYGEISITTTVDYKNLSTLYQEMAALRCVPCFCEGVIEKGIRGVDENGEPVYLHHSTHLKVAFINVGGGKAA